MSIQKIGKLFEKLENLTAQGKIEWEPTEQGELFQTSFPNFTVRLYPTNKGNDYVISIYNSTGTLLELATDTDLRIIFSDAYSRMKKLHESARGYALGVEQALDEIIKELDEKDELPF